MLIFKNILFYQSTLFPVSPKGERPFASAPSTVGEGWEGGKYYINNCYIMYDYQ